MTQPARRIPRLLAYRLAATTTLWVLAAAAAGLAGCGGDDGGAGVDGGTPADAGAGGGEADGGAPLVVPTVRNGSFEITTFTPDCYSNVGNRAVSEAFESVTAFGAASQIDVYTTGCYDLTPADGDFHFGLGVYGGRSDAIAVALSEPLTVGQRYRLRLSVNRALYDTRVSVGVSTQPTELGTILHESALLPDEPMELVIDFTAESPGSFITVQAEAEGIGWAFVDDLRLEAAP